jgi:hypothetical protein
LNTTYRTPAITDHGSLFALTGASGNDGNDPCRLNPPRDTFKQTGVADLIQGQANLTGCAPVGGSI